MKVGTSHLESAIADSATVAPSRTRRPRGAGAACPVDTRGDEQSPAPTGPAGLRSPVLEGQGGSDYDRYLRTDELLALQRAPHEQVHRDELLFQVTHQASELWLKLAGSEVAEATRALEAGDHVVALRLLGRSAMSLGFVTDQLAMLEQLSPCDFNLIRQSLGHGSGFDSPGFRDLRRIMSRLGTAFADVRERAGVELVDVYLNVHDHEQLYSLAEALLTLDERLQTWRVRHYRVVARTIGNRVSGIQGTPVEVLAQLISKVAYPELWEVRNMLTGRSQAAGTPPVS